MDLKYRYIGGRRSSFVNQRFPSSTSICKAVCLSGCRDVGTSADAFMYGDWSGAMTTSLLELLEENEFKLTYQELLRSLRCKLKSNGFDSPS